MLTESDKRSRRAIYRNFHQKLIDKWWEMGPWTKEEGVIVYLIQELDEMALKGYIV